MYYCKKCKTPAKKIVMDSPGYNKLNCLTFWDCPLCLNSIHCRDSTRAEAREAGVIDDWIRLTLTPKEAQVLKDFLYRKISTKDTQLKTAEKTILDESRLKVVRAVTDANIRMLKNG